MDKDLKDCIEKLIVLTGISKPHIRHNCQCDDCLIWNDANHIPEQQINRLAKLARI